MARRAVRTAPSALADGRVSDARVGERGRRCGPGKLDSTRPDRRQRRPEPARVADERCRARVPGYVADADIAARTLWTVPRVNTALSSSCMTGCGPVPGPSKPVLSHEKVRGAIPAEDFLTSLLG